MQKSCLLIVPVILVILLVSSCDPSYTPRPKGFFRIDLPAKKFREYAPANCPFSFEVPVYSEVQNYRDSIAEPCWKYIRFPQFDGEIFLSYRKVNNDVSAFVEDARTLAYKHTVKATTIDETAIQTTNNVYGMVYDIGGNAASAIQFYATDSTRHFIRGALYFNVPPQPDSLAPVIEFLREDIVRMVQTLKWK